MLSLRQPFRPDDHVSTDGREGRVARFTARATILVTMEGNQLRIPNANVFKAVIINYTANRERRFDFELFVESDGDPVAALKAGREQLATLDFVLKRPAPSAVITKVDAKATILFSAWIDQRHADSAKSRSLAIAAVKERLDGKKKPVSQAAAPRRSRASAA